ncbi:MAG: hypothetical protein HW421_3028 [Ignavibacteria bacterium]|nr:hypothetical protein [Ignavibacteria bacterium]
MNKRGKIIISRTDGIGDVVLTLPLAGILKEWYPDCKIIFLGRGYTEPIVKCSKYIDEFLDWDEIENLTEEEQKKALRKTAADVIIHVFPNKKIARTAKKAGIPLRIGTSHRIYSWWFCNRNVNLSRKNSPLHEVQLNMKLLEPLGIVGDFSLEEISGYFGLTKIAQLPEWNSGLLVKDKFNLILHPKTKGSAREWGIENFSKLIDFLPSEQYHIIITGTADEGRQLSALFSEERKNVIDATGKLDLSELISLINSADGLIAASTGPIHIAAALGKIALGLYAPMKPIHPGRWAPIGKNACFLVLDKNCNACRKTLDCECIRSILPEAVAERLMEMRRKKYII